MVLLDLRPFMIMQRFGFSAIYGSRFAKILRPLCVEAFGLIPSLVAMIPSVLADCTLTFLDRVPLLPTGPFVGFLEETFFTIFFFLFSIIND